MTKRTEERVLEKIEKEFVEKGAALEHERWAKWQKYLHSKCHKEGNLGLYIKQEDYEHWERQIATPYSELSEPEKEADREEVRIYLPLLRSAISQLLAEIRARVKNKE